MHLQAAEDLRAEADRVKREARDRADNATIETTRVLDQRAQQDDEEHPDLESTLKLAELLGRGGLPRIARLDVRSRSHIYVHTRVTDEARRRPA